MMLGVVLFLWIASDSAAVAQDSENTPFHQNFEAMLPALQCIRGGFSDSDADGLSVFSGTTTPAERENFEIFGEEIVTRCFQQNASALSLEHMNRELQELKDELQRGYTRSAAFAGLRQRFPGDVQLYARRTGNAFFDIAPDRSVYSACIESRMREHLSEIGYPDDPERLIYEARQTCADHQPDSERALEERNAEYLADYSETMALSPAAQTARLDTMFSLEDLLRLDRFALLWQAHSLGVVPDRIVRSTTAPSQRRNPSSSRTGQEEDQ